MFSLAGMSWVFSPAQGYIPIQTDHLKIQAQVNKNSDISLSIVDLNKKSNY